MSLFDVDFIEIDIYYRYSKVGGSKKIVIIDPDKAKMVLEGKEEEVKEEPKAKIDDKVKEVKEVKTKLVKEDIKVLKTKWTSLTWKAENDISNSSGRVINQKTGERQFDYILYRDSVVKKCLKEWDIKVGDQIAPITPEAIDQLPGVIVMALYREFEKITVYSEEDLGN